LLAYRLLQNDQTGLEEGRIYLVKIKSIISPANLPAE
jgi:hypothetical protein